MPQARKTAVVTGAARGIGRATADRFIAAGWRVALLDIDLAIEAAPESDSVFPIRGDVSNEAAVHAAFARIAAKFGRLDALVNNAGIAVFKPLLETSFVEWQRVLEVNLGGAFLCALSAVPLMRQGGGGAIVNITSISGLRASTLRVAYGTSKAALAQLTRQMAVEFAQYGIRANAVAPGPVDTAMAKAVHSPDIRAAYHDAIPLGRYGLEQELAEAIFFLCGEGASYITGQELAVDGGFEATGIGLPTLRQEGTA
ncbi:SDR family NAD(P)-dependent oxidoreductase [Plastoroseomonas arctica]|uniref:SDR family oxidoreductase n=1 Tax=Plastoroseomonas arctica TaxID=1509237 RepID=A0AAF1KK26_9PROT|nr:SDR family oxidoreductase [Plastoroseomonas arctica]MBR0656235.1 SDR family oxidoreductase [Plastoroseomonas arctica]